MKITIEDIPDTAEDEIVIRCRELDDSLLELIYGIKMHQNRIIGYKDGKTVVVNPQEIYYFEAVDNKVFIYCRQDVYESKRKLYEIEAEYEHTDFFRASKSVILNLSRIKTLSPAFSGRFEALLQNGEKMIVSRQYVPLLKKKLGL